MSDAAEFIDAALLNEATWQRAEEYATSVGGELRFYGASVGAVRGTIRDASRRYPALTHDQITALSSELWSVPVFERRLAAIVLLQSNLPMLVTTDLTRIEGFARSAGVRALVDPLAIDVMGPLILSLDPRDRGRADAALDRWIREGDNWLRRAALLSTTRAIRAGANEWPTLNRRVAALADGGYLLGDSADVVTEALAQLREQAARAEP